MPMRKRSGVVTSVLKALKAAAEGDDDGEQLEPLEKLLEDGTSASEVGNGEV
jgi:hypothetical protein